MIALTSHLLNCLHQRSQATAVDGGRVAAFLHQQLGNSHAVVHRDAREFFGLRESQFDVQFKLEKQPIQNTIKETEASR